MKILKKIIAILLIVLVGIQFIPTTLNQSNGISETDFTKTFNVPENIQNLLEKSCYDCHSNNTNYPWYHKIQPMRFIMDKHIKNGRKELNFSEFGVYSKRKQKSKLKSVASQIRDDEMPILSYILTHKGAKLLEDEKTLIIDWINKTKDSLK